MKKFLQNYGTFINGILHGPDRIIISGHIKHFYHGNNFYYFLDQENIKLKDFKQYVLNVTDSLKTHIKQIIEKANCYAEYLNTPNTSKEEIAHRILKENPSKEGLICALSVVEPCYSLTVKYNQTTKKLEKNKEFRKCLHDYFYYNDRELGLMHVRFQTWFPFTIQIYINGKEYLKKQLAKENITFKSYDNCITYVSDLKRAQEIADKFVEKKWSRVFDHFARRINGSLPVIEKIFNHHGYYWYIEQFEHASDVLFKDRKTLEMVLPYFLEYASLCQMGDNIFTFFGRKVHGLCQGEAVSDRKHYWDRDSG